MNSRIFINRCILFFQILLSLTEKIDADSQFTLNKDSRYSPRNITFSGTREKTTDLSYVLIVEIIPPSILLAPITKYNVRTCAIMDRMSCKLNDSNYFEVRNDTNTILLVTYYANIDYSVVLCVIYANGWTSCAQRTIKYQAVISGNDSVAWSMEIKDCLPYLPNFGGYELLKVSDIDIKIWFQWISNLIQEEEIQFWAIIINYFSSRESPVYLPKDARNYSFSVNTLEEEIQIKICLIPSQNHAIYEHLCQSEYLNYYADAI